jgi:hypothetical protein
VSPPPCLNLRKVFHLKGLGLDLRGAAVEIKN